MKTKLSLFCEKIIEAGWLAAIVAVPLFFNIYTARTFEPDKLTLMRSIAAVMLLAWVIKLLEEAQPAAEGTRRSLKDRLKQPMVLPTLTIVTVYVLSTALSLSPQVSLWGSYQRLQGSYTFISYVIIFALMAMTITRREQIERFITTAILASVPVALYGIIQHNGLDPLPWAGDVTRRVASNMGNAIFVSSYLIMVVPVTLGRLIASMKAIITEEDASWGYTVLSAIYIFVLAIQILTIIYSISRGPQIGLLGSMALMGLLLLLELRRQATPRTRLTLKEVGQSLGVVLVSAVAAGLVGGLGYLAGRGIESALLAGNLLVSGAPLVGAAIGGVIGFAGTYTYFAATGKGWRWLWVSWPVMGVITAAGILSFLVLLNTPDSQFSALTQNNAYLRRMAGSINTDSGTGKVRVLIWEGALKLISPHDPLGVEGEYTDGVNPIRPLVGYGPESMFNAFAFVYPPDLAHVENRGSSADRSHNETIDSLVMTGVLGWLAFYFLMTSLFYFGLKWLGWIPDKSARRRLIGVMIVFSVAGLLLPYFLQGSFTMSALGLPFGLYGSLFVYLVWQAFIAQPEEQPTTNVMPLALIGLLGAFAGHFLEVHFVFSIAATYTYFWTYLGLMVVLSKIHLSETDEPAPAPQPQPNSTPPPKSRRRRKGRRAAPVRRTPLNVYTSGPESWETWLGSLGLAMAIILIILTFDFVPVQFDLATGRYSLLWMTSITYLVGFAIAMADIAVKKDRWQTPINWGRGILLYAVTSMGYAGFYILLHSQQRNALLNGRPTNVLQAANGLVGILYGFYIAMFILFLIIAFMLNQKRLKGLPFMRTANWWLYPPLALAVVLLIFFKNINVVKADLYLKEGERYRSAQQWDNAIALHQEAINIDTDEDFYYLMLALDYQLQAQDSRLNPNQRQQAWQNGEETALAARNINKYNPDNTGNMGRYYFTLGQLLDPSYYDKALNLFKAAVDLAPQNVQYYNLLAQVKYISSDFDSALDWLDKSITLDAEFAPTWLQIGDTHAAKADIPAALEAHTQAILMNPNAFADGNFDNRLNFYISGGQTEAVVIAFQQYLQEHSSSTSKAAQQKRRQVLWAIGHTYARAGNVEKAQDFLQQSIDAGYNNYRAILELADIYLTQENYPQAEAMYQQALSNKSANQAQIYSSLGFIYARTGRLQEAINANLMVVQALPNDYDSNKNLALLYQQAEQIDQALTYAQKALELAPEASKADLQTYVQQLQALQQQPQ